MACRVRVPWKFRFLVGKDKMMNSLMMLFMMLMLCVYPIKARCVVVDDCVLRGLKVSS